MDKLHFLSTVPFNQQCARLPVFGERFSVQFFRLNVFVHHRFIFSLQTVS